jgi:protein disulfide-isomerase A6
LASKFFTAAGAARDSIYKEASALAAQVGPAAAHYIRVMEKVVSGKKEDYFAKESKRYVYSPLSHNSNLNREPLFDVVSPSLTSILQKRVLASEKLDEIKVKANVLAAFAAEKVAEARDTIERAIEDL